MMTITRFEKLLEGFEPDFDFTPAPGITEDEFAGRVERLRREATVDGYDALLIHADGGPGFSTTNGFLRYICDWKRDGLLIIPTDTDRGLHLLSFFHRKSSFRPAGEPVGVEAIWQISPFDREYAGRPGDATHKTAEACAQILRDFGYESGNFAVMGDESSGKYWSILLEELPRARISHENGLIHRMERVRSVAEQDILRTAAQLIDIGYQAACYVTKPGVSDYEIYSAFTFAQMARGGESGDGYQIGINQWGTHCGKPYGHIVRSGDLINLYISGVTYHGYSAQTARMIAIGDITPEQETTLEMCTDAVRRGRHSFGRVYGSATCTKPRSLPISSAGTSATIRQRGCHGIGQRWMTAARAGFRSVTCQTKTTNGKAVA